MKQFKHQTNVFQASCKNLQSSGLLFLFRTITDERGSDIEKDFSDGKEFIKLVEEGNVDPTSFRGIIDLDFCEIIWRDEDEILHDLVPTIGVSSSEEEILVKQVKNEQLTATVSVNSLESDVISIDVSESGESDIVFDPVEIIMNEEDDEDGDEMNINDEIDEEFEMNLIEEKAENNLILEGQHDFIAKLFNIETLGSARPEFDSKFFPISHQMFKDIEECVKKFVGSSFELTLSCLASCLKYLHDKSMEIYQSREFQLFETSSLQIYMIHCLKIVRCECFARNYHLTREEHESFKRILLGNMQGATMCAKLMTTSSVNYFFTTDHLTNHPNETLEQMLGKWLEK